MAVNEEIPLLKSIEKMLDDYLESGYIYAWNLPENSKYEKKIKDKLEQVSQRVWSERFNDPLTNVWSRQVVYRLIDDVLSASNLDIHPYCLAYFDIDKMKHINDYYGLPNGDAALIRIADALKSHFHPHHWICRFGGDEFLCLFNCDLQEAEKLIAKLQDSLKNLVIVDNAPEVRSTFKIGLTALKNVDTKESSTLRLEVSIHNIRNQLVIV
jgi:diguanylate cyclase